MQFKICLFLLFTYTINGYSQTYTISKLTDPALFADHEVHLKLEGDETAESHTLYLINRTKQPIKIKTINGQPTFVREVIHEGSWKGYHNPSPTCYFDEGWAIIAPDHYLASNIEKRPGSRASSCRFTAVLSDSASLVSNVLPTTIDPDYQGFKTSIEKLSIELESEEIKKYPANKISKIYLLRAKEFLKIKDYDAALEDLNKAINLDNTNYNAIYHKGLTYLITAKLCDQTNYTQIGHFAAAFKEWEKIPAKEIELRKKIDKTQGDLLKYFPSKEAWESEYGHLGVKGKDGLLRYPIGCKVNADVYLGN